MSLWHPVSYFHSIFKQFTKGNRQNIEPLATPEHNEKSVSAVYHKPITSEKVIIH